MKLTNETVSGLLELSTFFYCLAVETDDFRLTLLFSNKLSNKLFVCGLINDNYPPL